MNDLSMTIYTLGTTRRSEEDFVEILNYYEIRALIDVRRSPASRFPTYHRDYLEKLTAENGIDYIFLGGELGGFRKGGYLHHTATAEFAAGLRMIQEIAGRTVSVIMCAEKFPWKCHRKWIAGALRKEGWNIIHIIEKGKVWEPR